jgi:hypothetical protein
MEAKPSNRRGKVTLIAALVVGLAVVGGIWAFPKPSVIRLRDRTGKNIVGASISIMALKGSLEKYEVITDAQGRAKFPNPFPWKNREVVSFKIEREGRVIYDACMQTNRFATQRTFAEGGECVEVQWDYPIYKREFYELSRYPAEFVEDASLD